MFDTLISKGVEPARWLVILGIAYTLANSVWSFFDTASATPVTSVEAQAQSTEKKPTASVNWILAKNLFGEAGAEPVVANSDQPAVQTRLPLELRSVFVADDAEESAAIVAQRGKSGQLYSVGDTLPGNAELVEVLTDRIILRRAGVRETLLFPQWKSQFAQSSPPARDTTSPRYRPSRAAQSQDDESIEDEAFPEDEDDYGDDPDDDTASLEESATDLRERLSNDAEGTLSELGVEVADGGGYRLGNVADSPYLRQTGLQSGDVILSVNGRQVGDIEQDQLEIENILAQGSARIEIQRGERRFFITASIPKQ